MRFILHLLCARYFIQFPHQFKKTKEGIITFSYTDEEFEVQEALYSSYITAEMQLQGSEFKFPKSLCF